MEALLVGRRQHRRRPTGGRRASGSAHLRATPGPNAAARRGRNLAWKTEPQGTEERAGRGAEWRAGAASPCPLFSPHLAGAQASCMHCLSSLFSCAPITAGTQTRRASTLLTLWRPGPAIVQSGLVLCPRAGFELLVKSQSLEGKWLMEVRGTAQRYGVVAVISTPPWFLGTCSDDKIMVVFF